MRLVYLLGIILFSFFLTPYSFGQSLNKLNKIYNDFKDLKEVNALDSPKDIATYFEKLKEVFESLDELKNLNEENIIFAFVKSQILFDYIDRFYTIESESQKSRINFANIHKWNEKGRRFLDKMVKQDICELFETAKSNDKGSVGLNGMECGELFELMIIRLRERVIEIETAIYERLTKDKTYWQLQDYIGTYSFYRNYKQDGKYVESIRGYQAFRELFEWYTLDGENITIDLFLETYKNRGVKTIDFQFYDQIKNEYASKRSLYAATGKESLIQKNALKQFILKQPLSWLSMLMLQELIQDKPIGEALQMIAPFADAFCSNNPLYTEICDAYTTLEKTLSKANLAQEDPIINRLEIDYLNGLVSPIIRFIPRYDGREMAIIPFTNNQERIRLLEKTGENEIVWKEVPNNRFNSKTFTFETYLYDPNPQRFPNFQNLEEKSITGSEFGNSINTDFFVYPTVGTPKIAFFVSSSFERRKELNKEEQRFASPWPISDKLLLQEYQNGIYYRGKDAGNNNTDIYYTYYDPSKKRWRPAKHLGNFVNTRFSERSPFYDGTTLYFASEGHGGFGGYDLFSVNLIEEGEDLRPNKETFKNEYNLNTYYDEMYYYKGEYGQYFSSNRDGDFTIYQLEELVPFEIKVETPTKYLNEIGNENATVVKIKLSKPVDGEYPVQVDFKGNAILDKDYLIEGLDQNDKLLFKNGETEKEFKIKPLKDKEDEEQENIEILVNGEKKSTLFLRNSPKALKAGDLKLEKRCIISKQGGGNQGKNEIMFEGTLLEAVELDGEVQYVPFSGASVQLRYPNSNQILPPRTSDGNGTVRIPIEAENLFSLVISKKDGNRVTHFQTKVDEACELGNNGLPVTQQVDIPVQVTSNIKKLSQPIFFEYNDDETINSINNFNVLNGLLDGFIQAFKEDNSYISFVVVAYADTTGGAGINCDLSKRRAKSVQDYLTERGLPKDKVQLFGFGESNLFDQDLNQIDDLNYAFPKQLTGPKSSNNDTFLKVLQLNRRAEIIFCMGKNINSCISELNLFVKGCGN